VARRSLTKNTGLPADAQILLGDTMGELMLMFGASDLAFVGGSLVPNGGHNFIEPAAWELPLLSGPHLFNFAEVARLLRESGGLHLVANANELAGQVQLLATEPQVRATRAAAALQVANDNRGALARTLAALDPYLSGEGKHQG
jgi:3-deoxy-D-manno-octulosonic-acid transferase